MDMTKTFDEILLENNIDCRVEVSIDNKSFATVRDTNVLEFAQIFRDVSKGVGAKEQYCEDHADIRDALLKNWDTISKGKIIRFFRLSDNRTRYFNIPNLYWCNLHGDCIEQV